MDRPSRQKKIMFYEDLPRQAPIGLREKGVWRAYRLTVKLVGIQKARRPYPEHSFWKRLPSQQEDDGN